MSDETWKFQASFKFGQGHLLNVRASDLTELVGFLRDLSSNASEIAAVSNAFSPTVPAATPAPAVTVPPPVSPTPIVSAESVLAVANVETKQPPGKRTYIVVTFGDGKKASTFDTITRDAALTALNQKRNVAVTFVVKGQYLNIGTLRLL